MNILWKGMVVVATSLGIALAATLQDEVRLQTSTGTLFGVLELPDTPPPWTVALIHPGSGPTDRDGNTLGLPGRSDCLKLLAQGLAETGIASLRIDKRGVGQSRGANPRGESNLVVETYVDDASAWIAWLRRDSRFNQVAFIGHSEGSLVGILAAQLEQIDAFVSLAGPGRPADQVLLEQLRANPYNTKEVIAESEAILVNLRAGRLVPTVSSVLEPLFRPSVQPYLISLFKYDPALELSGLQVAGLVVQGTTDLQVSVADAERLASVGKIPVALIEGMNHALKQATPDAPSQTRAYLDPSVPLSADLQKVLTEFLLRLKR